MKITPFLWLIFTILFASFSIFHFVQISHSIPRFEWEVIESMGIVEPYSETAIENNLNLKKFISQWNGYVDDQNTSSFWLNLIAALTYLISALVAFTSIEPPRLSVIKQCAYYLCQKYTNADTCNKRVSPVEQPENKSNDIKN